MYQDIGRRDRPAEDVDRNDRLSSGGNGMVVFGIVALALILAVGYFLLIGDRRDDRRAQAVTEAARSVDDAATAVGDAAKNAANGLRKAD